MGGKRQRLDQDGRSIRQLELQLELARLRREEEEEQQQQDVNVDGEPDREAGNSAETLALRPPALRPPHATPQSGPANATASHSETPALRPPHATPQSGPGNATASQSAAQHHQPDHVTPGPSAAATPQVTLEYETPGPSFAGQPSARGQGRGRVARGARGGRPTGLVTVFVCRQHDAVYCQRCCAYEGSDTYWKRH